MQLKRALKNVGITVMSVATAVMAFAVPWLSLSPYPLFLGISIRTSASVLACAIVALAAQAALRRRFGLNRSSQDREDLAGATTTTQQGQTQQQIQKVAKGRYFHRECGARFDQPDILDDFVSKAKFYSCPSCGAPMAEISTPAPTAKPTTPTTLQGLPKIEELQPESMPQHMPQCIPPPPPQLPHAQQQEQQILLEVTVKGPRSVQTQAQAEVS